MSACDQTTRALESLEEVCAEPGGSSATAGNKVTWSAAQAQPSSKREPVDGNNAENRMLFFARVLRSAKEEEVRALFSKFGKVYDVNLFRAFQGAPTTRGCGLVTLGTHEEAVAAIEALDSKFTWDGMDVPMVVKWMDAALQRRRREQHLAAMRQALVPSMGLGTSGPQWLQQGSGMMGMGGLAAAAADHTSLSAPLFPAALEGELHEIPPAGCQPDAIKLFVGNIPKTYTEEQLLPFFETIGKVVELVIVRDKSTHESKGSAFVWYATRVHSERAILQFNLRHVLPGPDKEQERPLVVRRAKAPAAKITGSSSTGSVLQPMSASGGAAAGMPGGLAAALAGQRGRQFSTVTVLEAAGQGGLGTAGLNAQQFIAAGPAGLRGGVSGVGTSAGTLHLVSQGVEAVPGQAMAVQGQAGALGHLTAVSQPMAGGATLVSMQPAPAVQEGGLYVTYAPSSGVSPATTSGFSAHVDQAAYVQADGSIYLDGLTQQLVLPITLSQQQLAFVNPHLLSIQAVSGAQLQIISSNSGIFNLIVSGNQNQVGSAQNMLSSVLRTGHL